MSERYDPAVIEAKWRERWLADRIYHAPDDDPRPKWYALTMFPYPSGDLHTGHWYAMAPSDAAARYWRMRGYNVLFPMGFDAFGLPAENAAIKRGIDPKAWTYANIDRMRGQLRMMGASFDWDREVITSDPEYYKWTQWWFLKFYEKGLAYRAEAAANWCPGCQTVLANEQVVDGRCERSDDLVERRFLTQWFFRITAYAEELLRFDGIDWPERIKVMQTNWIGRSEGATLEFPIDVPGIDVPLEVFTTRPDTVFGATFMVLAPEHPLVERITTAEQRPAVDDYRVRTSRETEIERLSTEREKTGVFTGAYAINPFSGRRIPIWIADYVLVTYGTGAIMAVPAHDQRDFEFARKYGLPVVPVFDHPEVD
ncbi:MAG: leucine--tRNA ligase, partial [Chloroflexota bacterium]